MKFHKLEGCDVAPMTNVHVLHKCTQPHVIDSSAARDTLSTNPEQLHILLECIQVVDRKARRAKYRLHHAIPPAHNSHISREIYQNT